MTPEDIKRINGKTLEELQASLKLAIDMVWGSLDRPLDLEENELDIEAIEFAAQAILYKLRNS